MLLNVVVYGLARESLMSTSVFDYMFSTSWRLDLYFEPIN
jgi:hypothetical protein